MLIYGLILLIPKYDTFAWFIAQSYAEGKITNASTSDLLKIEVGEVQYLEDCNVQTSVSITNISNMDIPIKLDLLNTKKGSHSTTKVLAPGQSLMSATEDSDYFSSCESTQITYHLFAFEGYVDENIVIPLSADQMIKPVEQPEKEGEVKEENSNEDKQESEAEKEEEPKTPEQTDPPQQDQPNNDEAPTEPTPQPEENPETTDQENNQADTPAAETVDPPVIESNEDVQKDA